MKKLLLGLAAALLLLGATILGASLVSAQGQRRIDVFSTRMADHYERPPVDSRARGRAIIVLDREAREISYVLWVRKIDHVTEAHIHFATADRNGPIVAPLFDFDDIHGNPGTATEGTEGELAVSGVITEADVMEITFDELVAAMDAGQTYVNVHTLEFRAGEARGQLGLSDL
jgi:hypothetical protein